MCTSRLSHRTFKKLLYANAGRCASPVRVKKMTKQEMDQLKKDGELFNQELADSMDKGIKHPDVQALIERHYQAVNFFYECSLELYRNLGLMYVSDHRFSATYDKFRPGLAVFMRDAILYYCETHKK